MKRYILLMLLLGLWLVPGAALARAQTDTAAAVEMQKAKQKLFASFPEIRSADRNTAEGFGRKT